MEYLRYPFSAIVGREKAKLALKIVLVNPKAGGLLLSGAKGTGKSILVRSVARFTKVKHLVELPIGATEDMIFGSVNLEEALLAGKKTLQPGILHRAKDTLLYMDDVNLLRTDLLSTVLDSSIHGFFDLEREGLSYREEVHYTSVGTMNPEEGTLSPWILDRFGLFFPLENTFDEQERMEIARRFLEYEKNPKKFCAKYTYAEEALEKELCSARKFLSQLEISEEMLLLAAQYAVRANCHGNRAELFLIEAARALAALAQRKFILPKDIEEASLFVLPHRMGKKDNAPPEVSDDATSDRNKDEREENSTEEEDSSYDASPQDTADEQNETSKENFEDSSTSQADDEHTSEASSSDDDLSSSARDEEKKDEEENISLGPPKDKVFEALEDMRVGFDADFRAEKRKYKGFGKRNRTRADSHVGRYVRATLESKNRDLDLAFDATFRAAAPYQKKRQSGNALSIQAEDYRFRIREKRVGINILFVVDASGSMSAKNRMLMVKGVILSLLKEAYQKRDSVGLIAFRRNKGEVLLPVTRSIDLAEKLLRDLPTGGRTPLADGLECALQILASLEKRDGEKPTMLILITDGRANSVYENDDPVQRALSVAEKFAKTQAISIVLDTENEFLNLGIAPKLAEKMGANYYTLKNLSTSHVLHILQEHKNMYFA